ncbi:MAG: hypothetical protein NVSMB25_12160 [Thermoleophilaceae bacterium]
MRTSTSNTGGGTIHRGYLEVLAWSVAFTIDAVGVTTASLMYSCAKETIVNTCKLRFPAPVTDAQWKAIRWELFLHWDIRDVVPTTRPDTLQVVYRGRLDDHAWAATLEAGGFPVGVLVSADPDVHSPRPIDSAA